MSSIILTYLGKTKSKVIKNAAGSLMISKPNSSGPSGGVTSVNGLTGVVVLAIPSKTSQLTNDSGFLNSVPAQSFSSLTGKPTTLAGYGITDAYPSSNPNGYISSVPAQSFSSLTGKPTTLLGYGITDAYPLSGNPSGFITTLSFAGLTGKPTTLSGYGITDAYPLSGNPSGFITTLSFAGLTGKPTTLSGYGITDAYPLAGNPSGFLTSVPAQSFSSLTGKPTTIAGYGITDTTAQVLTGYVSGSGVVAATDSILAAIQKLNGNDGLKANLASPIFTGTVALPSAVTHPNAMTLTGANSAGTAIIGFALNFASQSGTSGFPRAYEIQGTYTASTGSATFAALRIAHTINQSGTASGQMFGIWYSPTITSVIDHIAIVLSAGRCNFNELGLGVDITKTLPTWLGIAAGTTTKSQINFAASAVKTTPVSGDFYFDNTTKDLKFHNGTALNAILQTAAVNTVTPTLQNRTITVNIAGTTYYITAKTTND